MTPTSLRTLLEALIHKLRGCNVSSDALVPTNEQSNPRQSG